MPSLRVISAGFLTTVQDLGRYGYGHLGISASGAADALSLRLGNMVAGNPQFSAALEMTLTGGSFEFEAERFIALAGRHEIVSIRPYSAFWRNRTGWAYGSADRASGSRRMWRR